MEPESVFSGLPIVPISEAETNAGRHMASRNPLPLDYSVGPQPWLDITELPATANARSRTFRISVQRPDGAPLLPPFDIVDPMDTNSLIYAVAQAMAKVDELAYGYNDLPYLWVGNHWMNVDAWMQAVSLSMHVLARTGSYSGKSSRCFYNEMLKTWRSTRKDELQLRPFGQESGVPVEDAMMLVTVDGTLWHVNHLPSNGNLHVLPVQSADVTAAVHRLDRGEADDSLLMRFLRSSLDEDQIVALQRWFGLHLVLPDIGNPEKLLFMHGEGGNGKGVVTALLQALLTDSAVAHLRLADLKTSANLEKLVGAVSMIGAEATAATDPETLKSLVSWEPITVNPKYRNPFVLKPVCLVTQSSNLVPHFDDDSDAMVRRSIVLWMKRKPSVGSLIVGLADRIKEQEYPLLVAWALNGACHIILRNRIEIPASVAEYSESVVRPVRAVDRFEQWLEFGDYEVAADELYKSYSLMCQRQKLTLAPAKSFFESLKKRLDRAGRQVVARKKVTGYEPCVHINDRSERTLLVPQLAAATATEVWFGLRIAEGPLGPPIGNPLREERRGLPSFA